jgi:translation elongation factor EF-Tu-like GTPase
MGIITISRIATQIIAVFSLDRDLDPQFEFFNDVRFFPDKIYVCINKIDLVEDDREKKLEEVKQKISEFFETRKIAITDVFITCGETVEDFEDVETYNNQVAEMILEITTKS